MVPINNCFYLCSMNGGPAKLYQMIFGKHKLFLFSRKVIPKILPIIGPSHFWLLSIKYILKLFIRGLHVSSTHILTKPNLAFGKTDPPQMPYSPYVVFKIWVSGAAKISYWAYWTGKRLSKEFHMTGWYKRWKGLTYPENSEMSSIISIWIPYFTSNMKIIFQKINHNILASARDARYHHISSSLR